MNDQLERDIRNLFCNTGELSRDEVTGILLGLLERIQLLEQLPLEQEPVAWMHPDGRIWTFGRGLDKSTFTIPLYTTPPASKPWVGLTDEEVVDLKMLGRDLEFVSMKALHRFARDIEQTLKEKNA